MEQFAIVAPGMGIKEDFPAIFLPNGVLPDSENVTCRYGQMWRSRGKLMEIVSGVDPDLAPSFAAANWTATNGWSADGVGTQLTKVTNAAIGTITPSGSGATPTVGLVYKIVITTSATSGAITYTYGGVQGSTITAGVLTDHIVAETTGKLIISGAIGSTATITAVSIKATAKAPVPDGFPILRYHFHVSRETGTGYLCAFTKHHIYFWVVATESWEEKFHCSVDCLEWSTVSYNDKIIATNNSDKVLVWDLGSGLFVPLGDETNGIEFSTGVYCTRAKCVAEYENFLVLGATVEAGQDLPSRIRWNAIADETDWMTGDADFADLEGSDPIVGFGKKQSRFYIFKEEHIHVIWLVSSSEVFNKVIFSTKFGCNAASSIVNTPDGKLYFLGSDYAFREIDEGEISQSIDPTVKEINPWLLYRVAGAYSSRYNVTAWTIPFGGTSTDNNLIVVYNKGHWEKHDRVATTLGEYARPTGVNYTWDTLPYTSWDTWAWDRWDTTESVRDFPVTLCGDAIGNTFDFYGGETEDGADYTGYFTLSTDVSKFKKPAEYKRLLLMQLYFTAGSGEVDVYVKRDSEQSWQDAGSVALTGTSEFVIKDLPCDYRAKNFYVKISGAVPFRFAGIIFKFLYTGER